ncbi:hypothetical protein QCA50_015343 [Cerrena zonata]|uniref:Fatty acid desaturase domain-containing protein n=1 Tax=Cerrena zonata TaxID=2478898 RepID=A0AAW0FXY5_9APHY
MAKTTRANGRTTVEQDTYTIPDIHIKELLAAIPPHCLERSALRSSLYILGDLLAIGFFWKTTKFLEPFIAPEHISLPSPYLYTFAKFSLWALYTFFTGLFSTGLWVIAHECGHQAFSESKAINNAVGWVLHSGLGVPYHAWRITHAKHHASTGHMTQDQVFVPKTRSERGLPKFNPEKEDLAGSSVTDELMNEMWEALGDSPIGAVFQSFGYLIGGWPLYITMNASGQRRYPAGTSHFNPSAPMFNPGHYGQIIISNVGVVLWLAAIAASINTWGFLTVFRTYLVPYLWVNHWLVLITFLQHTDPILPHYRAPEFTFARGALCTLDRELLGDCGRLMAWLGAFCHSRYL